MNVDPLIAELISYWRIVIYISILIVCVVRARFLHTVLVLLLLARAVVVHDTDIAANASSALAAFLVAPVVAWAILDCQHFHQTLSMHERWERRPWRRSA